MLDRIATSYTQVIKKKLKSKKYRDEKSGKDIAFSTAYSRGNEKALSDYNQIKQELKAEAIKPDKKKKTITKKVKVEDVPQLSKSTIYSLMSMDSWMNEKKKNQANAIAKIDKEIKEIENDPSLKKGQKKKQISIKIEEKKKEAELAYTPLDKDGVQVLGKFLKGVELNKVLPPDNFDDFMSNFIKKNNELANSLKTETPKKALFSLYDLKGIELEVDEDDDDDMFGGGFSKSKPKSKGGFGGFDEDEEEEEKKKFIPVDQIIKQIKEIKDPESKENKEKLGELSQQLAESLSIEYTLENVILNPTVGLPKFKSKSMMTPKAMSKIYAQEQERYGTLPTEERNKMIKKLEKKIDTAQGAEKEVYEKAMDAAVTDLIMNFAENPLEHKNKLPKNRVMSDPRIMVLADEFGRQDFMEKAAELTRTPDAKVHRDVMSSMLHSVSNNQLKKVLGEDDPLYKPFFEMLEPDYCPVHPSNERPGSNVDDEDCPVRLTEKEVHDIKQHMIDLYQDTTFFIAGGLNLEGYDDDETDVEKYNERFKKVKSVEKASKTELSEKIKGEVTKITNDIKNLNSDDVIQQQQMNKLVNEMRSKVTQHHIETLGSITAGLVKVLDKERGRDKKTKLEYIESAYKTIPGFPPLD